MELTREVELENDETLEVEFEAYPRMQDAGIGAYEFWGVKGFDSQPYLSCEYHGIKWNDTEYTKEQNKEIQLWLDNNYEELEREFCENYIVDI